MVVGSPLEAPDRGRLTFYLFLPPLCLRHLSISVVSLRKCWSYTLAPVYLCCILNWHDFFLSWFFFVKWMMSITNKQQTSLWTIKKYSTTTYLLVWCSARSRSGGAGMSRGALGNSSSHDDSSPHPSPHTSPHPSPHSSPLLHARQQALQVRRTGGTAFNAFPAGAPPVCHGSCAHRAGLPIGRDKFSKFKYPYKVNRYKAVELLTMTVNQNSKE